jgi:ribonuclease P protein component
MSLAAPATFRRAERLRDRGEFERLFRRGARVDRPSFVLLWLSVPGRRAAAFAASRRLGGSVWRNRARRRLREAYRRHKDLLPASGVRLCFVARLRAVEASFPELTSQVAEALGQAARRMRS